MYDLHNLGWNSFQQLCLTISREVLGQTVQSFLDSGGRDGAFRGTWKQNGREDFTGRFVIQCKFTSRSNHVLRPSDLTDEVAKVKRLVATRLCNSYVLMTNAGLPGTRAENIEALFTDAGVKQVLVLGSTWISQQILENKRLRMLVPRVFPYHERHTGRSSTDSGQRLLCVIIMRILLAHQVSLCIAIIRSYCFQKKIHYRLNPAFFCIHS
jgi:hypothetical protein